MDFLLRYYPPSGNFLKGEISVLGKENYTTLSTKGCKLACLSLASVISLFLLCFKIINASFVEVG